MLTPQKQWAARRGHSCRLGMKSAWRTCKIQSLHSSQRVVDVNVASFSEQLLRVKICFTKNKHTPSNNNPTNKQALRDQQLPKISARYSLKLHSFGFKGTWMQNTWAREMAHLWHVFIYLFIYLFSNLAPAYFSWSLAIKLWWSKSNKMPVG